MLKKILIIASMICLLVSSLAISCFAWTSEPTYDQSNENLYRYRYEFVFGMNQSFAIKDFGPLFPVSSTTDEFKYDELVTMESPFLVKVFVDDSLADSYYWTNVEDPDTFGWNKLGIMHSSRDAGGTGYQQTVTFKFGDVGSGSALGIFPTASNDNLITNPLNFTFSVTNTEESRYSTADSSIKIVVCTDQELPLLSPSGGNAAFSWSMTENVPPSPLVNIFDNLFSGFGVSISGFASGVKEGLSGIIWVDPAATNKVLSPLVTFIFTIAGLSIAMTVFYLIFRLIRFGRQR